MKHALGAGLLVVALAASACASTGRAPTSTNAGPSALIFNGRIRCSASIGAPAKVGHALRVRFRFRNISADPVVVDFVHEGPSLTIKDSDGKTYETPTAGGGYGPIPTKIAPGETAVRTVPGLRVVWSGPLQITPGCNKAKLPAVRVPVAATAAPASGRAAVAAVVAASGHLLDKCRPEVPGIAVDGILEVRHRDSATTPARCSVRLTRERGFYRAQELVVTPSSLRVRMQDGEPSWRRRNAYAQVLARDFVVTRDRAVTYGGLDIYTTRERNGGGDCVFFDGSRWAGGWGGGAPHFWIAARGCGTA